MRTLIVRVLLLLAVFGLPFFRASAVAAEPYGLSAMAQFERLPFLKTDTMAGGQSSYDRTGGNDDTRKFLYTDATGNVMLDVNGPGTLYRIWCTGFGGSDTIKIYFDGEATPRINTQLNNLFTGTYSPFLAPLVGNNTVSSGGFYCYLPLPFSKSIKIVTSGSFYYNIGYHLYSPDVAVTTWTGTEDSSVASNLWSNVGSDPKSADGNTTVSNAFNVSAGATQTLLDVSGPRSISSIKLKIPGIPVVTNQAQVILSDDGRAFSTSNQFKMTLDIANTGATLVRRLDYGIANQTGRVYVDGSLVGTWSTPGSDNVNHWRDSSFAIPSSFTAGKTNITIIVQFVSSQIDWNEFYYWLYSTVGGTNLLTDTLDVGTGHIASETSHSYSIVNGAGWSGSGNNWSYPLGTNQPTAAAMDALNNLWLKIAFDSETNSSVYAPIGTFFGMGQFGPCKVKSLPLGMDEGTNFYVYFPMPFTNRAVVQLVSQSTNAITYVVFQINHKPFTNSFANVGYFKTCFQSQTPSTNGGDILLLDKEGAGHFLGVVESMTGPTSRTYLEGDERIYVDDSLTPALYGTGTEDFYNGGWYFDQGTFTCPSHGYTAHYADTSDYTAAYRLFLADAIPFRKHIRVGIEHGPINDVSETVTALAYYYYNPNNLAVLTDQLDVGKTSSESAHSYTFTNQQNWVSSPVTYYYEGDSDNVGIADDGRVFTNGTSQFTLSLQPTNAGAILRRRFDQGLTNQTSQQASVYVDGTLVGTWYRAGTNLTSRWRDDDFMIPAAYTAGKSAIQIRLSGTNTWSEYYYSLYTVLPAGTTSDVPASTNSNNSNYSSAVTNLNPVIYLRLNEASGIKATNTGLIPPTEGTNNATGVTVGQPGPGYSGLGVGNTAFAMASTGYINLGSPAALTNGNLSALTLMAWAYFGPLDKSEAVIMGYGDDAWSFKRGTTGNSNVLVLKINGANLATTTGARPISDGVWHHIAAVYDGANARIYIDGTLESSQAKTGGIGVGGNSFNYPVMVGENSRFTGRQFNGKLDEVAMFTNALTAANILAIYNASEVSPTISIQPKATSVYSGNTVALNVFALGNTPLSYQWTKGGTVIPGATATNYVLSSPVTGDSGNYAVIITNLYGSITSSVAALTVTDSQPLITTQPSPTNILGLVGTTVTITPVVAGSAPMACQWKLNGTPVVGATNVILALTNIQYAQAGSYIGYFTNAFGGTNTVAVSVATKLTSWDQAALPDTGSRDRPCALGSDGTSLFFTRGAITANTFFKIPKGATNGWTTLTSIPNTGAPDGVAPGDMCYKDGAMWMVCKDSTVNQMLLFRYDIAGNSWGKGTGAFTDAGAALAVVETNYIMAGWVGESHIKITTNWMTGGYLSGYTSSTFPNLGSGASWAWDSCIGLGTDTNVYFVKHNSSAVGAGILGSVNKTGAPVGTLISGMPFNPGMGCAIEYMPTNLFADQHARLFVLSGGTNNIDGDGKAWTAATSTNQLAIYDLVAKTWSLATLPFSVDNGSEMCLAGDTLCFLSKNLDTAPLKIMRFVEIVPPVITQQPVSVTNYTDIPSGFSVIATGNSLSYQWHHAGTNLPGATTASYTVNNPTAADAGNYDVTITDAYSNTTNSATVTLTLLAPHSWVKAALPETATRDRHASLGSDGSNLYFTRGNQTNAGFYRIAKGALTGWTTLTPIPLPATVNSDSGVGEMGYMDGALWTLARKDDSAGARCVYRYGIAENAWAKGGALAGDGPNAAIAILATNKIFGGWIGWTRIKQITDWQVGTSSDVGDLAGNASHPWSACNGPDNVYYLKHDSTGGSSGILASINKTGSPVITSMSNPPCNPGMGCAIEYIPGTFFGDAHARLYLLRGGVGSATGDGNLWYAPTNASQLAVYDVVAQTWTVQTLPFSVDEGSEMCLVNDTLYILAANADPAPLKMIQFGNPTAPAIVQQPASVTVNAGQSATFSVEVSGVLPTFQWRHAGTPLLNATNSSLTLSGVSALNAGSYDVVIVSSYGTLTSDAATLSVNKNNTVTKATRTSGSTPSLPGVNVTFAATVTNAAAGVASGTVTFKDAGTPLATNALDGSGVATFSTTTLAHGSHAITAEYNGDDYFNVSTSFPALSQVINTPPQAAVLNATRGAGQTIKFALSDLAPLWSDADAGDVITLTAIGATSTNGVNLQGLYLTTNPDGSYVITNNAFIGYANLSNVGDQFTYTITDSLGATATGTVNIVVSSSSQFGHATGIAPSGDHATMEFVGHPGYAYNVERSTNIVDWVPIWTTNTPVNGLFQFTDHFGDLGGQVPASAYYRLSWVP